MALPEYTGHIPREKLVRILCTGTYWASRYAEVPKIPWSKEGMPIDPGLFGTCLRCGYRARDNYNWKKM